MQLIDDDKEYQKDRIKAKKKKKGQKVESKLKVIEVVVAHLF